MASPEERLLKTDRFSIARVTRKLPSGSLKQREVVRHPGSVVILPLLGDDRICLIENHRIAVDRVLIELPAGTLDAGESPDACARRELQEETGYRVGRLEKLTAFFAAPGILDEYMHLFVARDLVAGQPEREPEEEIQNRIVSWTEALGLIESGQICDAKTMIGLLLYHMQHRTGR